MPEEPYGAQVLRRMHDDSAGLLHEYDDFLQNSDDPATRKMLTKALRAFAKANDDVQDAWRRHPQYSRYGPLYGMDPEDMDPDMDDLQDEGREYEPKDWYEDEEEEPRRSSAQGPLQDVLDVDEPVEEEDLGPIEPQDNRDYANLVHKDFARVLKSAADFLDGLREEDEDKNEPDDDLGQFFDPLATRKRKSFSREQQMESRSRAGDLDNYATKIKDPDVLDKVQEAIDLLRGIVEARQRHDSTEPLEPHELDQITANAKSLRSILDGKRGKFPSGDLKRTGHKSLDAMCKDVEKQTKALTSLQSDLDRLTRLL